MTWLYSPRIELYYIYIYTTRFVFNPRHACTAGLQYLVSYVCMSCLGLGLGLGFFHTVTNQPRRLWIASALQEIELKCFFVKQPLHKVLRYRIRVEVTSTAVSYFVSFTSARVYFNPYFAIVFVQFYMRTVVS